jgi:hypothetical protein
MTTRARFVMDFAQHWATQATETTAPPRLVRPRPRQRNGKTMTGISSRHLSRVHETSSCVLAQPRVSFHVICTCLHSPQSTLARARAPPRAACNPSFAYCRKFSPMNHARRPCHLPSSKERSLPCLITIGQRSASISPPVGGTTQSPVIQSSSHPVIQSSSDLQRLHTPARAIRVVAVDTR